MTCYFCQNITYYKTIFWQIAGGIELMAAEDSVRYHRCRNVAWSVAVSNIACWREERRAEKEIFFHPEEKVIFLR